MIYSVNFMDMAGRISPLAFARYLKETGWLQYQTHKETIKIFQYENNELVYQVTIPVDPSLSDYNIAMYNAIQVVAGVENKSVEQIMLFLLNPNTDIIKIRLDKMGVESGNILFDDAIRLYDNAKKLLAATASDVINPKLYHYGRPEEAVQKFLSDCRYGQTEIGSYVVSIVCPFVEIADTDEYRQLSIFSDDERCANSLTRKVTNKLLENICTIKQSIDDGEYNRFLDSKNMPTISVNFFEALEGLNIQSENTVLEIKAEWSPIVKSNRYANSKVKISHDYYQPIKDIISDLKKQKNKYIEIVGRIKILDALPNADKRQFGTVKISCIDENGKQIIVTTVLNKSDYERAIEAHHHGKYVKAMGEMKNGRKHVLDCTYFDVI